MSGSDIVSENYILNEKYTREEAIIEALLFASGESVELTDIAEVINKSRAETEKIMVALIEKVNSRCGGIILRRLDNAYKFCTVPDYYEVIKDYFERPVSSSLSRAASETLAVIAYMQPVTRAVIENVRGVNCDSPLSRLLERELICEVGKADTPGRPILYGTTELFLQSTGISSLSELPKPVIDEENNVEKVSMFEDKSEKISENKSENKSDEDK